MASVTLKSRAMCQHGTLTLLYTPFTCLSVKVDPGVVGCLWRGDQYGDPLLWTQLDPGIDRLHPAKKSHSTWQPGSLHGNVCSQTSCCGVHSANGECCGIDQGWQQHTPGFHCTVGDGCSKAHRDRERCYNRRRAMACIADVTPSCFMFHGSGWHGLGFRIHVVGLNFEGCICSC